LLNTAIPEGAVKNNIFYSLSNPSLRAGVFFGNCIIPFER